MIKAEQFCGAYFAASEPSMSVQITLAAPPQPLTRAMSFFST